MDRYRYLAFSLLLASLLTGACWAEFPERAFCGNELLETGETCDGTDFGDETCRTLGYRTGALGCSVDCTHDFQDCEL